MCKAGESKATSRYTSVSRVDSRPLVPCIRYASFRLAGLLEFPALLPESESCLAMSQLAFNKALGLKPC